MEIIKKQKKARYLSNRQWTIITICLICAIVLNLISYIISNPYSLSFLFPKASINISFSDIYTDYLDVCDARTVATIQNNGYVDAQNVIVNCSLYRKNDNVLLNYGSVRYEEIKVRDYEIAPIFWDWNCSEYLSPNEISLNCIPYCDNC